MKKSLLNLCLLSSLLLISCGSTTTPSDNISDDGYTVKEDIYDGTTLELSAHDSIYVNYLLDTSYQDSYVEVYIDNRDVAKFEIREIENQEYAFISALQEGTTKATIIVDDTYKDEITINVTGDSLMGNFKTDAKHLYNKTFTVFGDSISDIKTTAYEANRPDYWCEQLVSKYNMTMYNYAIGGSTTGYCRGLVNRDESFKTIVGTFIITNNKEARQNVALSDYVFIYFGNNDYTYRSILGKIGDVNKDNYDNTESFKGSYSYLIDEIRSCNPNAKIVCLSLSYSTWGLSDGVTTPEGQYCKTRSDMRDVVKEIAETKNCKYIDIFELWNSTNWQTYIPDGIHPQTAGYDLIVEEILKH